MQETRDPEVAADTFPNPTPAAGDNANGKPKTPKGVKTWSTKKMLYTLRVFNLLNGFLLVLAGILVFITGLASVTFTTVREMG
jgi:hypothetical protein